MPAEPNPLTELEAALAGLAPAPPRLDRDGLLYAAGRTVGARRWKQVACGLAVTGLALAAFIGLRPVREPERVVIVRQSGSEEREPRNGNQDSKGQETAWDGRIASSSFTASPSPLPSTRPELEMRWRMLRWGPDSVPISVGGPEMPARSLEQDLDLPPGSLKGADGRHNGVSSPW